MSGQDYSKLDWNNAEEVSKAALGDIYLSYANCGMHNSYWQVMRDGKELEKIFCGALGGKPWKQVSQLPEVKAFERQFNPAYAVPQPAHPVLEEMTRTGNHDMREFLENLGKDQSVDFSLDSDQVKAQPAQAEGLPPKPHERVHDSEAMPWDIRYFAVEETVAYMDALEARIAQIQAGSALPEELVGLFMNEPEWEFSTEDGDHHVRVGGISEMCDTQYYSWVHAAEMRKAVAAVNWVRGEIAKQKGGDQNTRS